MASPFHQPAHPSAGVTRISLADLTPHRALATIALRVNNPSGAPLLLRSARWRLAADQRVFATGAADLDQHVAPGQHADIRITAPIVFAEVLAACPAAEPGCIVPYTANIELTLDTPDVPDSADTPAADAHCTLLAVADAELPIPAPLTVALESVRFDSLGWSRSDALLDLLITNRCPFDLDLLSLELRITLGSTAVLSHVHRCPASPIAFAPAGQRRVAIPVTLSPANMGYAAFCILQQPLADYHLTATANCDSAHGPITWHIDHAAQVALAPQAARTG